MDNFEQLNQNPFRDVDPASRNETPNEILHVSEALTYYPDKRTIKEPPTHTLTRLAELVLTLNALSFNDQYYRQIGGVAMGTKMGPNYACLFVGFIEERIRAQYTGFVPQLHKRYNDDVVGTVQCTRPELEQFIDYVWNFHPAFQFTFTISELELPFLVIKLAITNNRTQTSIHYKETDTHNYLHYTSFHHSTHVIGNKQYHTASFYVSDGYVLMMSTFLKKLRRC